jgi:hypothetical protein
MPNRRIHKIIGFVLLAPVLVWAVTGVFFLVRPAYEDAYGALTVKTYPLSSQLELPIADQWLEFRYLETVLGSHLLVRTANGWEHLDGSTGEEYPVPDSNELQSLVADAIAQTPSRYGELAKVDGNTFLTTTGVAITLSWATLSLTQTGNDTRWINKIYDIHYLRWTGIGWLDEIVGVLGLVLLILMAITGARLLFWPQKL